MVLFYGVPVRNFYDNFEQTSMFMKFVDKEVLDLKEIVEIIDDRIKSQVKESDIFTCCAESPKDY
ncbi:MAG: hypothetical protein KatS3mg087_0730 [Patescibacteria group bacterium]|nr:MAG: hypothetical protein KatS3mg087_0730 [Patescibacteria group bacterium]